MVQIFWNVKQTIMKQFYVYTITNNKTGKIEYIGESGLAMNKRLNCHVSHTKHSGSGKFAGRRNEISMNIIKRFDTKSEAYAYQCELQKQLGWETDAEKAIKGTIDSDGKLLMLSKEVVKRRIRTMIERHGVPIIAYDKKTGVLVNEYESISEAAINLKIDVGNLNRCINGIRYKSVGGFIFKKK